MVRPLGGKLWLLFVIKSLRSTSDVSISSTGPVTQTFNGSRLAHQPPHQLPLEETHAGSRCKMQVTAVHVRESWFSTATAIKAQTTENSLNQEI